VPERGKEREMAGAWREWVGHSGRRTGANYWKFLRPRSKFIRVCQ
jgi:hypothetical protein